jgi:hypothetical protein
MPARYVHPSEDAVLDALDHWTTEWAQFSAQRKFKIGISRRQAIANWNQRLKELVGERFEPPTPWSRTVAVQIPSAFSGVAYQQRTAFSLAQLYRSCTDLPTLTADDDDGYDDNAEVVKKNDIVLRSPTFPFLVRVSNRWDARFVNVA